MDRQAFLSSMPFLVPCPTAVWPPRRSNNSGMSTRIETLLPVSQDSSYKFKLSLEPAIASAAADGSNQQTLEKIQPAFFGRIVDETSRSGSRKSKFDPSLADIQVAVESSVGASDGCQDESSVLKGRVLFVGGNNNANNNNNSHDSASNATPSSTKITQDSMQLSMQRLPDSWPLVLYFKMDKEGIFRVDGKQLLHVEIVHAEIDQEATDSDTTPKKEWKVEAIESLRVLEKQLLQLSSNIASNTLGSPESSSFPSSTNEAGQKDGGYPTPGGQSHSHSHSTLTSSSNSSRHLIKKFKATDTNQEEADATAALQENHWVRKGRRRRDALLRSRAGMQSVQTILDMPLSVVNPEKILAERVLPKVHVETQALPGPRHPKSRSSSDMAMGPLLTGIAEDLSASYGTHAETKEILNVFSREIEERRCHQMDQLLDSFFPKPPQRQSTARTNQNRTGRRGRDNISGSLAGGEKHATSETKSAEEVIKSVQRLLKQQRDLVAERSSYLHLPTRG